MTRKTVASKSSSSLIDDQAARALLLLGQWLRRSDYRFVTVTPETHRRVLARPRLAADLRDVFGWNLPFHPSMLDGEMQELVLGGSLVKEESGRWRSLVRFSSLEGGLYAHSAYPTDEADSVFFGPDTYRFCRAIRQPLGSPRVIVDVGCGAGAGGIVAGADADTVYLSDINETALAFARVNAELNGLRSAVRFVHADILSGIEDSPDLIIANPPYLKDAHSRTYRHGGGDFGEALAVRILRESLKLLRPGGRLMLYSGAPFVRGVDQLWSALEPHLQANSVKVNYEEIDPDIFGEEIDNPPYAAVERIAAVLLVATMC